jgi:hypothetical protein
VVKEGLNIMEVDSGTKKGEHIDEDNHNKKEGRETHIDGKGTSTGEGASSIPERKNSDGEGGIPTRGRAALKHGETKNPNL